LNFLGEEALELVKDAVEFCGEVFKDDRPKNKITNKK
jgi:hypothetical protein